MADALRILLLITQVGLTAGLLATCLVRLRQSRCIGTVVERELTGPLGRVSTLILLVLGCVAAFGARGELSLVWTLPPLATAVAFAILRPGYADRVCGTEGVRRGWYVRSFEQLEEWRLTGDHLRFRLRGEWEAVPLAAALHPAFLERLRAAAPDRESELK